MQTIADFIRRDIQQRVEAGQPAPARLTLQALAEHYDVSLSPVRQAVEQLLDAGVLIKHDNGRLDVNRRRRQRSGRRSEESAEDATLRGTAELQSVLEREVIHQSLAGRSDYLREAATAERHGVSRTAVRQVLGQLAGQGLIVHIPRCGWRVRPFDQPLLAQYLQVREVLELEALELARPHLEASELERMLAGNLPDGTVARLDNRVHAYLIERAQNQYIRDFFDRHGTYYTTLFDFAAPETAVAEEMAEQHRIILQALLDGAWRKARHMLREHIQAQQPIVTRLLEQLRQG